MDTYQVYEVRREVVLRTATYRNSPDRRLGKKARWRVRLDSSPWNDGVDPGRVQQAGGSTARLGTTGSIQDEYSEQEDLIRYIDLELDALIARVQLISYRYILL